MTIVCNIATLFAALLAGATVMNPRFGAMTKLFWAVVAVLAVWRVFL